MSPSFLQVGMFPFSLFKTGFPHMSYGLGFFAVLLYTANAVPVRFESIQVVTVINFNRSAGHISERGIKE
jgi:hypothetical protein